MSDIKINIEVVSGAAQASISGLAREAKKAESQVSSLNKGFKNLSVDIKDAFSGTPIGRASNALSEFVTRLRTINPVILGVSGAFAAAGLILERSFAGEQIEKINKQFELLAKQANVSADALRSGLEGVAAGAIDTEDLLKSANKFLAEFGENANRIPQVLDLARKSTALFGGEVTQNFEQISQAIVTGNTRSLRSLGIVVDQEAAYKSFAAQIGVTANQLNEAGRKQAILDEVLRKGGETFKNVNPDVAQLGTAFERLKVQIGEVADTVAIRANATFGTAFTNLFNEAAKTIEAFNLGLQEPKKGLEGTEQSIRKTELAIDSINGKIEFFKSQTDAFGKPLNPDLISKLEEQRSKLTNTLDKLEQDFTKFNERTVTGAQAATDERSKFIDPAKAQENAQKQIDILTSLEEKKAQLRVAELESQFLQDGAISEAEQLALLAFEDNEKRKTEAQLLNQVAQLDNIQKFNETKAKIDLDQQVRENNISKASLKLQESNNKTKLQNQSEFFSTVATLQNSSSKALIAVGKTAATASILVDGAKARASSFAYGSAIGGPFLGKIFEGLAIAAQASQIAQINGIAFEQGGIVPGNSFSGDNVFARVNSGEMILNRQQQATLFDMANSRGSTGDGVTEITTVVQIGEEEVARAVSRQVARGFALGEGGV